MYVSWVLVHVCVTQKPPKKTAYKKRMKCRKNKNKKNKEKRKTKKEKQCGVQMWRTDVQSTKVWKLANMSATTSTERVYYKIIYVMKNIVMLMLGP